MVFIYAYSSYLFMLDSIPIYNKQYKLHFLSDKLAFSLGLIVFFNSFFKACKLQVLQKNLILLHLIWKKIHI